MCFFNKLFSLSIRCNFYIIYALNLITKTYFIQLCGRSFVYMRNK
ncbi:unnamed protein product [Schistosoma mattheei]|uniref:Uncharacterized protein n=1 Tax=Schistosoma mattheei TaxID=31246 RepID=A0A183NLA6_9TREM|nr:unnamed protein product [Schistosoma mattheei]